MNGVACAVFCLGDRAYGPQFCAAGRKLAVRLLQLGATKFCPVGYGDEQTLFDDLDEWFSQSLWPAMEKIADTNEERKIPKHFRFQLKDTSCEEKERKMDTRDFFRHVAPATAYSQTPQSATVCENKRLTPVEWEQDTRHLVLEVNLSFKPGDVACVWPTNSPAAVNRFLKALGMDGEQPYLLELSDQDYYFGTAFEHWPRCGTLRQWLAECADFQGLPEREDLRALSKCCDPSHAQGRQQQEKLVSLSEPEGSSLYKDYVVREKRDWVDVLYDFDSISLSVEELMALLPPLRYREYSIANAPVGGGSSVELCVAMVEGQTPLGRSYQGLCSKFLASAESLRMWIRPGSFEGMPLDGSVLYIGAGTGIAPLRGLIQARVYDSGRDDTPVKPMNSLVFGCRKHAMDFYYGSEWQTLVRTKELELHTAFSRDQEHKVYVQQVLEKEVDITQHVNDGGAIYIAGNPLMARDVKQVIVEAFGDKSVGEAILTELQRTGKFAMEAW